MGLAQFGFASADSPENPSPSQNLAVVSMLQGSLNTQSSNSSLERPFFLHRALTVNSPVAASLVKLLRKKLLNERVYHLESPSSVNQCSLDASKSNTIISEVRNLKFSGFLKNLVTILIWHRTVHLNHQGSILIRSESRVDFRCALGLISNVGSTCLVWLSAQWNCFCWSKSCAASSSLEDRSIRPFSLSMRGDWLPVSKPEKCSAFRLQVSLSSMLLVLTKRASYDHVMVVVLKKGEAMNVPLQSSTMRCPVDWVLLSEFSVVGFAMVKALANVYSISNKLSDSNFGSLSIMEEFANKFCNSFAFIKFLMYFNLCLGSLFGVLVFSIPSISDLNNVPV